MTTGKDTAATSGRTETAAVRDWAARGVQRSRRSAPINRLLITPRHIAGMVVAAVSAVIVLCGHSGVGMLAVLIGMCCIGIVGHSA